MLFFLPEIFSYFGQHVLKIIFERNLDVLSFFLGQRSKDVLADSLKLIWIIECLLSHMLDDTFVCSGVFLLCINFFKRKFEAGHENGEYSEIYLLEIMVFSLEALDKEL